ncbi:hypothetical protein [Variovorax paradoxus]|uniref:hypothetical protein n=1 Tax=Variovorax paradoxus TaxID=34073 RepID=UPI003D647D27
MLLTNEIDAYWTSAQARIDDVLLPMAIKVKCFPEGTTTETLPKHYADFLRAADAKPQLTGPRHKATEGLWLLFRTCDAGRTLARLRTKVHADLKDVPMGSDGAIAMSLVDEPFLQGHDDFFEIFEQYAPRLVGYLEAMNDLSQQNVERGAAGRREIGEQTMNKVKEVAPKFMHMPKDAAASLISEEVGRSASTVRRLLSELFPGAAWVRQIRRSDT